MVAGIDPPLRSALRNVERRPSNLRNLLNEKLVNKLGNRAPGKVGQGELIGFLVGGAFLGLEEVIGVPLGATSDIVDVNAAEDGTIYTVNVNALASATFFVGALTLTV